MNRSFICRIGILLFFWLLQACSSTEKDLVMLHQVTGPIETNCYLLYDPAGGEAALIDVGGPIDSLISHIETQGLQLKYIFATHCHMDHMEGIPAVRERYREALVCYNRDGYRDFLVSREWLEENWDPGELAALKAHPQLGKWFEYDFAIFAEPDIALDGTEVFRLGDIEIQTILAPGHSRGSICFAVGDRLFTGDLLFRSKVGRTDILGGSPDQIVTSVQGLYERFPDETRVFPGHGEFTTIGTEKAENDEVSASRVQLEN